MGDSLGSGVLLTETIAVKVLEEGFSSLSSNEVPEKPTERGVSKTRILAGTTDFVLPSGQTARIETLLKPKKYSEQCLEMALMQFFGRKDKKQKIECSTRNYGSSAGRGTVLYSVTKNLKNIILDEIYDIIFYAQRMNALATA